MKIFLVLVMIFTSVNAFAMSWNEIDSPEVVTDNHFAGKLNIDRQFGNIAQFANNIYAIGIVSYKTDKEGAFQYTKTVGASLVGMEGIKQLKLRERPDHSDKKSFPSGHATGAFAPAAFLYYRYGVEYAALPLVTAFLTSYSRVEVKKHYITDTATAAALSFVAAKFFTTPYLNNDKLSVMPIIDTKSLGLNVNYKF